MSTSVETRRARRRALDARRGRHRAAGPRDFRRAKTLAGALGVTLLGAVLPGRGLPLDPPPARLAGAAAVPRRARRRSPTTSRDLQPAASTSRSTRPGCGSRPSSSASSFVVWAFTVVTTYAMARPLGMSRLEKGLGALVVALLCILVGAAGGPERADHATPRRDFVSHGLRRRADRRRSPRTSPRRTRGPAATGSTCCSSAATGESAATGIRTDSVILLSMDTQTGKSVMFSLPRNMMNAQFPEDSPLHDVFPDGFRGEGDPGSWMLNAVYGQVPALYPAHPRQVRERGRRRDQAGGRRQPRHARRLLPADQPAGLPAAGRRDRRGDGQHQRADRDQRQHRPRHPADRLPRARARTSTSTASTRSGTPAAAGAPTTTSGCCGSAAWSTRSSTRPTR